ESCDCNWHQFLSYDEYARIWMIDISVFYVYTCPYDLIVVGSKLQVLSVMKMVVDIYDLFFIIHNYMCRSPL
ncbi:hypothetical protein ACJX0J_009669, partial [Zea mays]